MKSRPSLLSLLILCVCLIGTTSFKVATEMGDSEVIHAERSAAEIWETSGLLNTDISFRAFQYGLSGYFNLKAEYGTNLGNRLTIIDYSLPSDQDRMVVYDLSLNQVVFSSLVSHGRNSGNVMATDFSNIVSSYQSSLGFYLTAETYFGKHGYSLRLDGIDPGFNCKARQRAIVMHGADYASRNFISEHGRLGRSLGCPSLPRTISTDVIDYIKEGTVMFIYADDEDYLNKSLVLNG